MARSVAGSLANQRRGGVDRRKQVRPCAQSWDFAHGLRGDRKQPGAAFDGVRRGKQIVDSRVMGRYPFGDALLPAAHVQGARCRGFRSRRRTAAGRHAWRQSRSRSCRTCRCSRRRESARSCRYSAGLAGRCRIGRNAVDAVVVCTKNAVRQALRIEPRQHELQRGLAVDRRSGRTDEHDAAVGLHDGVSCIANVRRYGSGRDARDAVAAAALRDIRKRRRRGSERRNGEQPDAGDGMDARMSFHGNSLRLSAAFAYPRGQLHPGNAVRSAGQPSASPGVALRDARRPQARVSALATLGGLDRGETGAWPWRRSIPARTARRGPNRETPLGPAATNSRRRVAASPSTSWSVLLLSPRPWSRVDSCE